MRGYIRRKFALLMMLLGLLQGLANGNEVSELEVALVMTSKASSDDIIVLADKNKIGVTAGQQSFTPEEKEKKARTSSLPESSPGFDLAKKHLPELLPVLKHLQNHSPQQYEKALRDLDRSARRLDSIQRRDSKLFDISLREWKTRGQIDLLKAKVRVKKSESDQKAILQQLRALRDIELERLGRELALIDERLVVNEDRIRQTRQMIDRGVELRKKLNDERSRLESETIDEGSHVYMRAIGNNKNNADLRSILPRPALPPKATSNKVSDDIEK